MSEKTLAELVVKEYDKNPPRLRGGSGPCGFVYSDDKEACAYSIEQSNSQEAYAYGLGLSMYQGTNAYHRRQGGLVVKPISLWRDGDNRNNDRPENRYSIKEFAKLSPGVYRLVLKSNTEKVETHEINFNNKEIRKEDKKQGEENGK